MDIEQTSQLYPTPPGIPLNQGKRNRDYYEYTSLGDIRTPGRYNIYGVVIHFSPVQKVSRGTEDFLLSITLVDPTYPDGMTFNIFAEIEEKLPKIKQIGDIFRAHRVQIALHESKFNGIGSKTGGFAFLVVDVSGAVHYVSKIVTFDTIDKQHIKALKIWWEGSKQKLLENPQIYEPTHQNQLITNFENSSKYRKTFEQVLTFSTQQKPFPYFDIICQVVNLIRVAVNGDGQDRNIIIGCSDGTGYKSPLNSEILSSIYQPPPEPSVTKIFNNNLPFGAIFNVVLWDPDKFSQFSKLKPGQWIYLKNVQGKWYNGSWEIKVERLSHIHFLNEENEEVEKLINNFKLNCKPLKKIVTMVALNDSFPKQKIIDILIGETGKFRCEAQVKEILPSNYRNITRAFCSTCNTVAEEYHNIRYIPLCKKCGQPMLDFIYMFSLKLEDQTGSLESILYKEDGERFFLGIQPSNLYENDETYNILCQKIQTLLNGSWIDCCLKSYLSNKKQRKFRIFDTRCLV